MTPREWWQIEIDDYGWRIELQDKRGYYRLCRQLPVYKDDSGDTIRPRARKYIPAKYQKEIRDQYYGD